MCDFKTEIKRTFDEGTMLAVADVTIDNTFVLCGVKLVNGSSGLFISMPSECYLDTEGNKKYFEIARATNNETRQALYSSVKLAYDEYMLNQENRAEMAM